MTAPRLWVWNGSPDDEMDVLRYVLAIEADLMRQPVVVAEIARLRAAIAASEAREAVLAEALRDAEEYMTDPAGGRGCICKCPVIDGHAAGCAVIAALSTLPARAMAMLDVLAAAIGEHEAHTDASGRLNCAVCAAIARFDAEPGK